MIVLMINFIILDYNYENEERIGFIDYIYGIGESYYLNYINNSSLENNLKY